MALASPAARVTETVAPTLLTLRLSRPTSSDIAATAPPSPPPTPRPRPRTPMPTILEDEVLFSRSGAVATVTLNRPRALNALNLAIVTALTERYRVWERDARVKAVVVKGAGGKAFCAGGDVKAQVGAVRAGRPAAAVAFFRTEITVFHHIYRLRPTLPQISLLDGYVMGGGAGLALHGEFQVATERTLFSMPENAIALFPDVGASFFLPRLADGIGAWLGVTGARIGGADVVRAGLATHYMPSAQLPALVAALTDLTAPRGPAAVAAVRDILDAASVPVANLPPGDLDTLRPQIDAVFGGWRDPAITVADFARRVAALPPTAWTTATAAALANDCPQSQALTLTLLRAGAVAPGLGAALRLEFRALVSALTPDSDFVEGVTARLVEKRAPVWRGADDAATIAARLAPLAAEDELELSVSAMGRGARPRL